MYRIVQISSRSWAVMLVAIVSLTVCNVVWATNYNLSVSAGCSGGLSPNPVEVGKVATGTLTGSASTPTSNVEGQLRGPYWAWYVDVEYKATRDGTYAPATGHYNVSVAHPNNTSPSATLNCVFTMAGYWKVNLRNTCGYSDAYGNTWNGEGTTSVTVVAGQWVYGTDEQTPSSPSDLYQITTEFNSGVYVAGQANVDMDKDNRRQCVWFRESWGTDTAGNERWGKVMLLGRIHHRSSNWTKAYVWGLGAEQPFLCADNWSNWSDAANDSMSKRTRKWVPEGTTPVRKQFQYSVEVQFGWQLEGNVDNWNAGSSATGKTQCFAEASVTTAPSSTSANAKSVDLNVDRTESSDQLGSWQFNFPFSLGVTPAKSDNWSEMEFAAPRKKIEGTINSAGESEVSVKCTLRSNASLGWSRSADGVFQALAQCQVFSLNIDEF